MQVTPRAPKRVLLSVVTACLFAVMLVGCSSGSPAPTETTTSSQQQSIPTSPEHPVAQCVTVVEEDAPIAGPSTYVVQFASQDDYDEVTRALRAMGLVALVGGDGKQERFQVTLDQVSQFLSPADLANLQGMADEYRLITDFAEEACTTAV